MRSNFVRCSAFALIVLCGCKSDTTAARESVAGYVFRAESVDSRMVPFVLSETSTEILTVFSDFLAFGDNDRLTRNSTILRKTKASGAESYSTTTQSLRYNIDGNRIELLPISPCPINADCVGNDSGTISGKTIYLNSYSYAQPSLVTFRRAERTYCPNCSSPGN